MNKIEKFSILRLWLLLKYEVCMDKARFLALLKVLTIMMALPFAFGLIADNTYGEYFDSCINNLGFIQIGSIKVAALTIFNIIGTKERRILYFSLPANNAEKLVAQLLLYTVGFAMMIVTVYVILEALHYPIVTLLGKGEEFRSSIAPIFFNFLNIGAKFTDDWRSATIFTIYTVAMYSTYINMRCRGFGFLTGYLIAIAVFIASFFIIVVICDNFVKEVMIIDETGIVHSTATTANVITIILCSAIIATIILLWRNNYKKFKQLSII